MLNLSKCKWLCDKHVSDVNAQLCSRLPGQTIARVDKVSILGSIITDDASESATSDHRILNAWASNNT